MVRWPLVHVRNAQSPPVRSFRAVSVRDVFRSDAMIAPARHEIVSASVTNSGLAYRD